MNRFGGNRTGLPAQAFRADAIDAGQYARAPWSIGSIPLIGDRRRGESFPTVEGQYFRVLKCDAPATFALNQAGTQPLPAVQGLTIHAPFRGLTLFHPIMSSVGAGFEAAQPRLVYVTSPDPDVLEFPQTEMGLGMVLPVSITISGGVTAFVRCPLPQYIQKVSKIRITVTVTAPGALEQRMTASVGAFALDDAGNLSTANGAPTVDPAFNYVQPIATFAIPAVPYVSGGSVGTATLEISDVPIPSWANVLVCSINTAQAGAALSGTTAAIWA